MSGEDGKEQAAIVTREEIEERIDQLLSPRKNRLKDKRGYYDLDSALVKQWPQRPLSNQNKPLKDTAVRVEIADLLSWAETHLSGDRIEHPPLKYVALSNSLETPAEEEGFWRCTFRFYKDGPAVLEAEESIRTLPDPNDPNPTKLAESWTSRSIQDTKRPISSEDLRMLNKFLDHIVPLRRK